MIRISATALKDFTVCKSRYMFRQIEAPTLITTPLIMGTVVHNVVDKYEQGELEKDNAHAYIQELLFENLSGGNVEFSKWDSIPKMLENCRSMWDNYLEHKRGDIIESEKFFEIPQFSKDGIEFKLLGRIDQIININGRKCVVDLKTSRKQPTKYQIMGDYQFTFYYYAYNLLYDEYPNTVYNFHLRSGKYIKYPRSDSDVRELIDKVDEMVATIDYINGNWKESDKSKGWHCNRCFYRDICYNLT